MINIIYFFVALFATTMGSMAGLGGGVIIKPSLDFMGNYDIATISVLSAFTLFAMSSVSTAKYYKDGMRYDKNCAIYFGIGSVAGGYLGKIIFVFIKKIVGDSLLGSIQSLALAFVLVLVLYLVKNINRLPKYKIESKALMLLTGIILGIISSFLGIGGGPLNVAILMIFFNMTPKKAAIHSVLIILLAQISSLATVLLTTGFGKYDLSTVPYMMLGGVLGGFIGAYLNKKYTDKTITKVFSVTLILVILINIYNLFFKH